MANPGPATTVSNHPQQLSSNQALRLIASYQSVNLNAAGDTVLPVIDTSLYSVSNIILTNVSTSLTTATVGVFTGPGATGTTIRATATSTANTSASVVAQLATVVTTAVSSPNLYFNVGTPQGAAATGDVFVYGYDLTFLP